MARLRCEEGEAPGATDGGVCQGSRRVVVVVVEVVVVEVVVVVVVVVVGRKRRVGSVVVRTPGTPGSGELLRRGAMVEEVEEILPASTPGEGTSVVETGFSSPFTSFVPVRCGVSC